MIRQIDTANSWTLLTLLAFCLGSSAVMAHAEAAKSASRDVATIDIDTAKPTGKVSPYVFGQNIEHEHGTISGGAQDQNDAHGLHTCGLWAEMQRNRKFEENWSFRVVVNPLSSTGLDVRQVRLARVICPFGVNGYGCPVQDSFHIRREVRAKVEF